MSRHILTIGHSSHPLGIFLWLLRKHDITALADIRSYPGSKRHPHFSRESLTASLAEESIQYHWLKALDIVDRNRAIARNDTVSNSWLRNITGNANFSAP